MSPRCLYCHCTDADMGRDDSGEEAKWPAMTPGVCSKPQCQAALRRDERSGKRLTERTRRDSTRPIRKQVNQAAKRKRERRERKRGGK